jgi:hypothetical protein
VLLILPDLLNGKLKTKRRKLTMLKSVCVLFSILFVVPLASADVFKCVGKYGEALYQNFPCQFESIGWVPTDAQGAKKSLAAPTQKRLGDAQGLKKSPAGPAEPQIGMTTEEVRAIWGEPTDTHWEEPGDGDLSEIWSYGDSRSVRFGPRGRVAVIQQ